jgi:dihydrofolate reductase
MAKISLIAAMDQNRAIGYHNQLPWHLPADLAHFKRLTLNKPVLMGRKTHEAIGRPLPQRKNLIITREKNYRADGCEVFHGIEEAFAKVDAQPEVMVIGGAEIYQQCLPFAHSLYLTLIQHEFKGDTFFPVWNTSEWQETSRQAYQADANNNYPYSFVQLERICR